METKGLAPTTMLDVNAYRNGLNHEQMVEYLSQHPNMARSVVEACPEHRLLALGVDGWALSGIKKSEQTVEEVEVAVRQEGRALRYASKMVLRRNPQLYRLAVESNGLALRYVPPLQQYEGIYVDAVRSNADAIELVPEDERSVELYLAMVQSDGRALRHVPRRRISKKLAKAAFASDVRAIENIPQRFIDTDMALTAVSKCGSLLKHVPEKLVDIEMASAAVANDGDALGSVPNRLKTEVMCRCAVEAEPMSIRFVPPRFFDALISEAVGHDWRAIKYVSKPSKELLAAAFEQSPLALEYFPPKEKTREVCEEACERDADAFRFVPRKSVTSPMLVSWLSSFFDEAGERLRSPSLDQMRSLKSVDRTVLRNPEVADLMRRLGKRETKYAKWVGKSFSFLVTETITCGRDYRYTSLFGPGEWYLDTFNVTSRVNDLDGLNELLGGDLSVVEFRDYPFEDYDPTKHDLSCADLPVETLRRIGAYDDTAYRALVSAWGDFPEIHNPAEGAPLTHTRKDIVPPVGLDSGRPFYYVSDLHLNHMLTNRFPDEATERQIHDFLADVAVRMVETAPEGERDSVLIVVGDTSYNIDVARIFFNALREAWRGRIVCILGNHELWDWSSRGPKGRATPVIDDVIAKYGEMLNDIAGIWLLQNRALILHRDRKAYYLSEEQLTGMDDDELSKVLYRSSYVVLGGIGFSGFCDDFNAESGIYRDVLTSRAEDVRLSEEFSRLHERVRRLAPNANVIVATHTPMSNWSTKDYQPGWVYLNGHTHRNRFIEEGDVRVYADNQIGYDTQSAGLMRFYVEGLYDPFRHLPDGIHEVERIDYRDFNRSRGILIDSFTREGRIIMLKREPVYMFLFVWEQTGDTYLLSGARITKLDVQDPKYYYEHMLAYAHLVKNAFSLYMNAINTIADEVKAFGGVGRAHGCIVDIDFFNHVYLDPFTGKLKFYFAESINDRIEYEHLDTLLERHVPELLAPYEALLAESADGCQPLVKREEDKDSVAAIRKTDTLMYRPSNVILSVQRLFESNVIRVWNEDVLVHVEPTRKELPSDDRDVMLSEVVSPGHTPGVLP